MATADLLLDRHVLGHRRDARVVKLPPLVGPARSHIRNVVARVGVADVREHGMEFVVWRRLLACALHHESLQLQPCRTNQIF